VAMAAFAACGSPRSAAPGPTPEPATVPIVPASGSGYSATYPEGIVRASVAPWGPVLIELVAPGLVAWAGLEEHGRDVNTIYIVLSDTSDGTERVDVATCRARAEFLRGMVTQPLDPAVTVDVDACATDRRAIVHVAPGAPKPAEWLRIEPRTRSDGRRESAPILLTEEGEPDVTQVVAYHVIPLPPGAEQNPGLPVGFVLDIFYVGANLPFITR
jgi:hypothetical protein